MLSAFFLQTKGEEELVLLVLQDVHRSTVPSGRLRDVEHASCNPSRELILDDVGVHHFVEVLRLARPWQNLLLRLRRLDQLERG